ncbi:MAG: SMC-Scp complex subunit ScpB [Candidatus Odinarchaeia archaeon]
MSGRDKLAEIEAALYVAGRPLSIDQLMEITKIDSERKIKRLLRILKDRYNEYNSALEISEFQGSRYALQLKSEYNYLIPILAPGGLLSLGALKTLSLIALKQPITQSQVIKLRGSHVYRYIKLLEEKGFIEAQPKGRTKILRTTKMFADYFGFDYDIRKLKIQLKSLLKKEALNKELMKKISEILKEE